MGSEPHFAEGKREEGEDLTLPWSNQKGEGGVGARAKKAITIVVANARILRGNALYDRNVSRRGLTQRMQVAVMRGVVSQ